MTTTDDLREQVFNRDRWTCRVCGWACDLVRAYRENEMGLPGLKLLRDTTHVQDKHLHMAPIDARQPKVFANMRTVCNVCLADKKTFALCESGRPLKPRKHLSRKPGNAKPQALPTNAGSSFTASTLDGVLKVTKSNLEAL